MNEKLATLPDRLGHEHPLTRVDDTTRAVERQAVVCGAFIIATGVAATPHLTTARWLLGSAIAVELVLVSLVALLRDERRRRARDLIIHQGPLSLRLVETEAQRLMHPRHRAQLADRLLHALESAEQWHRLLPASRPPPTVRELIPHADAIHAVAQALTHGCPPVRVVAMVERLLDGGYSSALYAGERHRLVRELERIRFELARG